MVTSGGVGLQSAVGGRNEHVAAMHRCDGADRRDCDPRNIHQLLPGPVQEVYPPRGGPGTRPPARLRQPRPGERPRDIVNIAIAIYA
ncbi:unnamed protein product, partial [Brenthis ino]